MNAKHWTNNPELIERFILQGMNPEERNELEDHLRICEVCKRAVRNEQLVVAGIRRSGREQFKTELRKKLHSDVPAEKKTPWIQILSAAAVVVILLTVGVYNRWFETQKESPNINAEVESPQLRNADAKQPAEMKTDAMRGRSLEEATPSSGSPQFAAKSSTQNDVRRIAQSPRAQVPAPTTKQEEQIARHDDANNATLASREQAAAVMSQSESELASETIWLEGNTLTERNGRSEYIRGGRAADEFKRAAGLEKDKSTTEGAQAHVRLSQQNSLTLPAAQQKQQQLNKSQNIMVKLERTGNQTQLTLYLDSLMDEHDLANVRIETPRSDSLILNLPNQRIGYKLPANVDARQMRIAK